MTAERRKVLDMLAAGKINSDEAEQLLNHLAAPGAEISTDGEAHEVSDNSKEDKRTRNFQHLRVVVNKPNRNDVNIRLPLKLVLTGLKLSTLLPVKAGIHLSDQTIDLSYLGKLKGEALNAALAELDIEIETDKGDKVHIFCE